MKIEKIYIAEDGTKFLNEQECITYESENTYKLFFEHYGKNIYFYDDQQHFVEKTELRCFNYNKLDYILVTNAEIIALVSKFIEDVGEISSPFNQFGYRRGLYYYDYDMDEWHDWIQDYNDLVQKNVTPFDHDYLLDLRKE